MGYSIVGDEFAKFVKEQIETRNEKVAVKRDLFIHLDPEVAKAFDDSTAVSTLKGTSANMCKLGQKRRRTHAEVEQQKLEEELREQETQLKLNQIDAIQE